MFEWLRQNVVDPVTSFVQQRVDRSRGARRQRQQRTQSVRENLLGGGGESNIQLDPIGVGPLDRTLNRLGITRGDTTTTDTRGGGGTTDTGDGQEDFMKYYVGWNPEAARQDFMRTFGGDIEALKRARGVSDDEEDTIERLQRLVEEATGEQDEELFSRAREFEEENPFRFDEALARQSAEERFNPFYEQSLRDYLRGVRLRTERTVEDRDEILKELTAQTQDFTGREKRLLELATENAREGAAGRGMFFSGGRFRQEGLLGVESGATLDEFMRKQGTRGRLARREATRGLEDIELERGQKQRELGRFEGGEFIPGRLPEFDILSEIEQQRKEARGQRELERFEFLGRVPGEEFETFEQRRDRALGRLF